MRYLTRAHCLSAWSPQTQSSPLVRIWQCWPVAIYRNRWNANCQNRIIKFPYFPTDVPSKSLSVYKYCLISVVWNLSTFKEGNIECLNVLFHGQNIKCQKIFTLQSGKAKHSRLSSCFSPFDRWFSSLIKCHQNFQEKKPAGNSYIYVLRPPRFSWVVDLKFAENCVNPGQKIAKFMKIERFVWQIGTFSEKSRCACEHN